VVAVEEWKEKRRKKKRRKRRRKRAKGDSQSVQRTEDVREVVD